MLLNIKCLNNNNFTIKLENTIFFGDLYTHIAIVLNISPENILYIIYNGVIIDNNPNNKFNFSNNINIFEKSASIYVILNKNNDSKDETILNQFKFWNKSKIITNYIIEDVKITLSQEDFSNLVDLVNVNDIDDNEKNIECMCGIKLEEEYTEIGFMPCNHLFHYKCIKKHLTEFCVKCPNCNTDIRNFL